MLGEATYQWFLNPASFSSPGAENMSSKTPLLEKKIEAKILPKLQNKDQNSIPAILTTTLKFYEVSFLIKQGKRQSEYERKFYVFHYGPEKVS